LTGTTTFFALATTFELEVPPVVLEPRLPLVALEPGLPPVALEPEIPPAALEPEIPPLALGPEALGVFFGLDAPSVPRITTLGPKELGVTARAGQDTRPWAISNGTGLGAAQVGRSFIEGCPVYPFTLVIPP
jgi:hypothetical protein